MAIASRFVRSNTVQLLCTYSCFFNKTNRSCIKTLTFVSVADEITEPINDQQNVLVLTELQKHFIVLSGYKACTEEAIRFLVEEEGLSRTDPVLLGLERHLHRHEMNLEYYQLQRKQYFATLDRQEALDASEIPLSYFVGCPLIQRHSGSSASDAPCRTFGTNSDFDRPTDAKCVSPAPSLWRWFCWLEPVYILSYYHDVIYWIFCSSICFPLLHIIKEVCCYFVAILFYRSLVLCKFPSYLPKAGLYYIDTFQSVVQCLYYDKILQVDSGHAQTPCK